MAVGEDVVPSADHDGPEEADADDGSRQLAGVLILLTRTAVAWCPFLLASSLRKEEFR